MWKNLLVLGFALVLTSCTSFSKTMDQIRVGWDKDQVLSELGSPKRTFRENSLDYWTYLYFQNSQEWRRDVVFENGKVIRVTRATLANKSAFQLQLENSNNVEEFEAAVRAHQKSSSNFKYIDGGPGDGEEKKQ